MREHKPREIKLSFDHMFDDSLASGEKQMTRRPVKVEQIWKLAKVASWQKSDSLYGRWEGYEHDWHGQEGRLPLIQLQSPVGEPGDWFKHETANDKTLTFEIQKVRIELLWEIPVRDVDLEGFAEYVQFLKSWAKFYPDGSPFAARKNPWVWASTFKQEKG